MSVEQRTDETFINIVTRRWVVIENDKEYGKKEVEATRVRKTTENSHVFDIQKEK